MVRKGKRELGQIIYLLEKISIYISPNMIRPSRKREFRVDESGQYTRTAGGLPNLIKELFGSLSKQT